ncbi:MAG: hypothetical protein PHQ26_07165, partial [Bacteroidales bacterium]|nr:hypothetical protein [Bacteroidales bacterium]
GFSYFNMCRNLWFRMCQKTFRFLNVSLAPAREWEEYVTQFVHESFAALVNVSPSAIEATTGAMQHAWHACGDSVAPSART